MPFDQVESKRLMLRQYEAGKTLNSGQSNTEVVKFETKFNEKPQILLSIASIDIKSDSMNYEIAPQQIEKEEVKIKLTSISSQITALDIQYIAFVDNNVSVNFITFNYKGGTKQTFLFKQLPQDNKVRKAVCFPLGFNYGTSSNKNIKFTINVNSITQTSYEIEVLTSETTNTNSIQINCIEYFQQPDGAYVRIADFQTYNFLNSHDTNNPIVKTINFNSNFGNYQPISFFGMINYHIYTTDKSSRIRMYLIQSPLLSVAGSTWYINTLPSLDVGYFQYQMINCKASEPVNIINDLENFECISECPYREVIVSAQSINICKKCDSEQQYIHNNNCLDHKPDNTYCDSNKVCQTCRIPCRECTQTLRSCISCMPFHYLNPKLI